MYNYQHILQKIVKKNDKTTFKKIYKIIKKEINYCL